MTSPAQIDANRANAQHSTGPRTADGIATAKYNATRHGLTGKQIVIKGEDPAEYDALRDEIFSAYSPANEIEAMFTEDITQALWRKRRAERIEAQILDTFGALECMIEPEAQKAFANVTRYLAAIEKGWRKSCSELEKLQKARLKVAQDAAEASTPPRTPTFSKPQLPGIGFVSQKPEMPVSAPPVAERKAG